MRGVGKAFWEEHGALPTTVPLMATISGASVQPQTADVRVRVPLSAIVGPVSVVRLMTAPDWKLPGSVGESPQLAAPSAAQRTKAARRLAPVRFPVTTLILASEDDPRPPPRVSGERKAPAAGRGQENGEAAQVEMAMSHCAGK